MYDYKTDPNEFTNLVGVPEYKKEIKRLINHLPKNNQKWDKNSYYTFQPYFVKQKERSLGEKDANDIEKKK